jgi:carbamate kinase
MRTDAYFLHNRSFGKPQSIESIDRTLQNGKLRVCVGGGGVTVAHTNQTGSTDYFNTPVRLNQIATAIQAKQVGVCAQRNTSGVFAVIFPTF